jgi:hypothetical protein
MALNSIKGTRIKHLSRSKKHGDGRSGINEVLPCSLSKLRQLGEMSKSCNGYPLTSVFPKGDAKVYYGQ